MLWTDDEPCGDVQRLLSVEADVGNDGKCLISAIDGGTLHWHAIERDERGVLGGKADVLVENYLDGLFAKEQQVICHGGNDLSEHRRVDLGNGVLCIRVLAGCGNECHSC